MQRVSGSITFNELSAFDQANISIMISLIHSTAPFAVFTPNIPLPDYYNLSKLEFYVERMKKYTYDTIFE